MTYSSAVDELVRWFGSSHRDDFVRLQREYRTSPGGEDGLCEDLSWAVHVMRGHVSWTGDEHAWAEGKLKAAGLGVADLPRECPECGQATSLFIP